MAALTTALIATAVAGAGLNAVNSRNQGKAARAQGNYEGDIYDFNASVADLQAKDALARGTEAERLIRQQGKQVIGSQRAALGASGVELGSGSAADVQADTAYLSELDAITAKNNARREAWGFNTQAQNMRMQGQLARKAGKAGAKQGAFGVATSLLSGGIQAIGLQREYK